MTDLDELVRASLDDHAAGEVDHVRLLEGAKTHALTYRRRRRVALVLSAALVVVVVAGGATVAAQTWLRSNDSPFGVGARPDATSAVALPAVAEPGAAAEPGRVGEDPNVIHFAAPALVAAARFHTWTSAQGYEQLEAGIDGNLVYVAIGRDPAALDAAERQNNVGIVVRSQPVPGLSLRIQAKNAELAQQVTDAIDLNRSQRLIVPFQLRHRPDQTELVRAYVGFVGQTYANGGVIMHSGDGATMEVQAQYMPDRRGNENSGNHRVGGHAAYLYPGEDEVELLDVVHLEVTVRIGKAYHGFTVADADAVLAQLSVTTDVERISSWPQSLTAP